jgi:hypothetical protein
MSRSKWVYGLLNKAMLTTPVDYVPNSDLNHEDENDDPEEIEIRRRVVGAAYSQFARRHWHFHLIIC